MSGKYSTHNIVLPDLVALAILLEAVRALAVASLLVLCLNIAPLDFALKSLQDQKVCVEDLRIGQHARNWWDTITVLV